MEPGEEERLLRIVCSARVLQVQLATDREVLVSAASTSRVLVRLWLGLLVDHARELASRPVVLAADRFPHFPGRTVVAAAGSALLSHVDHLLAAPDAGNDAGLGTVVTLGAAEQARLAQGAFLGFDVGDVDGTPAELVLFAEPTPEAMLARLVKVGFSTDEVARSSGG